MGRNGLTGRPRQWSCVQSDDYYSQCRPADGGSSCSAGAELQMPAPAPAPAQEHGGAPEPALASGSCENTAFSQCGGMGWNGLTCCPGQCSCVRSDDHYSQCLPADGGSSCDAVPSPSPVPPSPPGSCENTAFGQCGGVDWHGLTCCPGQCSCVRSDDYYSQCRPADGGSSCDAVPSPSPAPLSPPGSCENTAFGQCGGMDWHGLTCC